MSTTYKILTEGLSLTRFAGGNFECHLNIHKYISYCESYSLKLNYRQVEHLKDSVIDFLRVSDSDKYELCSGFKITRKQVKTLITDLHIYLNDPIHKS